MRELIDSLTGYPGLFVWCLVSGILIPLPEDVPHVLAGLQIAEGQLAWLPAVGLAITGTFLRDSFYFVMGRSLGERAFSNPWVLRLVDQARIAGIRQRIREKVPVAVLVGRFSLGLRAGTFLCAGAMGVRPRDFVRYDLLALCVSVPVMVTLGSWFGQPMLEAVEWAADRAGWVMPLLAGTMVLGWWLWNKRPPLSGAEAIPPRSG